MRSSAGGLAELGFVAAEPSPSRSHDDASTQVLPVQVAAPAPPSTPPPGTPPPEPDDGTRSRWPLVAGAALAVVVAMAVAFAIGFRDRGDDHPSGPSAGSTAGPGATSDTSPATRSSDQPTEADMADFVETYLQTVVDDPAAAFDMLTPAFQEQSGGIQGYVDFWGDVRSAKILDISADPAKLEVSYTYRYTKPGAGARDDDVVLRLTYEDGTYLIAQEL